MKRRKIFRERRKAGEPDKQRREAQRRSLRLNTANGREFHKAVLALLACNLSIPYIRDEFEKRGTEFDWNSHYAECYYIFRRLEEEGIVTSWKVPSGKVYFALRTIVDQIKRLHVPKKTRGEDTAQAIHYTLEWLRKKGVVDSKTERGEIYYRYRDNPETEAMRAELSELLGRIFAEEHTR